MELVDGQDQRLARHADMTGSEPKQAAFIAALAAALGDGSFVRLTLGKVRGDTDVVRAVATPFAKKGERTFKLVTTHARKDTTETLAADALCDAVAARIGAPFQSVTLVTANETVSLVFSRKGKPQLTRTKGKGADLTVSVPAAHDRQKARLIEPNRPYLIQLGISAADGTVKPSMASKYRQIDHFVQILNDIVAMSALADQPALRVVDIGSGKGYLTFALYDHLSRGLGKATEVKGIELRADLVDVCNRVARDTGMAGLTFKAGAAAEASDANDIVIALHACDTATDDALFHGIAAGVPVIVTAPCCQHEIAPQIATDGNRLAGLNRFGLFKQRFADLVTDAIRVLALEQAGYKVRVIEFVSTEHTAKNVMLAAVQSDTVDRQRAARELDDLLHVSGVAQHHLLMRLAHRDERDAPQNM